MPNIVTNHAITYTNFTRVNKIEAMYGRSRANVKVEPRLILRLRPTFGTLPLLYLRA